MVNILHFFASETEIPLKLFGAIIKKKQLQINDLILYEMKQHISKCDKLSLVLSFNFSLLSIQLGLNTQKHVCIRSDGNNAYSLNRLPFIFAITRKPFSTMEFICVFLFILSHTQSLPFILPLYLRISSGLSVH